MLFRYNTNLICDSVLITSNPWPFTGILRRRRHTAVICLHHQFNVIFAIYTGKNKIVPWLNHGRGSYTYYLVRTALDKKKKEIENVGISEVKY